MRSLVQQLKTGAQRELGASTAVEALKVEVVGPPGFERSKAYVFIDRRLHVPDLAAKLTVPQSRWMPTAQRPSYTPRSTPCTPFLACPRTGPRTPR